MTVREPSLKSIEGGGSLSVCMEHAFRGQAQHVAEARRRIYWEKLPGEEKDADLVRRLCWRAVPSSDLLSERRDGLYCALEEACFLGIREVAVMYSDGGSTLCKQVVREIFGMAWKCKGLFLGCCGFGVSFLWENTQ